MTKKADLIKGIVDKKIETNRMTPYERAMLIKFNVLLELLKDFHIDFNKGKDK